MVDTAECHDNFWKLIAYLQSLSEVDLPANTFRVLAENDTAVVEMLQRAPRAERLAVIRAAMGNGGLHMALRGSYPCARGHRLRSRGRRGHRPAEVRLRPVGRYREPRQPLAVAV